MSEHILKTWPEPFQALWEELKLYEIRRADRDFKVGDTLILQEWDPEKARYLGRVVVAEITYITRPGQFGLPEDLCVLGVRVASHRFRLGV